jgi:hypothetical protein
MTRVFNGAPSASLGGAQAPIAGRAAIPGKHVTAGAGFWYPRRLLPAATAPRRGASLHGMSTQLETKRSSGGRIAAFAGAGVVGLLALVLLAAGGVSLWANHKKDDDGYIATASDRFATSTYALATDNMDIDTHGAGWLIKSDLYGKVRLKATPRADKPLFVGIARTSAVDRYLNDTAHATVTDVSYSPFRAKYRVQNDGATKPGLPGDQRFWVASAEGSGQQTLKWDVKHGSWSVVVMNADGSRGVDAGVSAGANVPILTPLGWGALGGGLLLLAIAGGLVAVGVRSPRRRSGDPDSPDVTPAPVA